MEMVDSSPLNSRAKISPGWCQLIRAQVPRTVGMPMDGRLLWGGLPLFDKPGAEPRRGLLKETAARRRFRLV